MPTDKTKKPEETTLYPENEKAMARQLKEAGEMHPPYPPLSQEIIDSNNEAMARQAASVPTPTQAEMDAIRDYQDKGSVGEIPGPFPEKPVDPVPVDPAPAKRADPTLTQARNPNVT
jgi:hypothetical protein